MKQVFALAFTLFFVPSVFAASLAFQSGRVYRASYTLGNGRAVLAMTGSPEHVIITVGIDKCESENTDCGGMRGMKGDIHGVIFRLVNKSNNTDQLKYEAIPLALTEKQNKPKITLEVDLSPNNVPSGYSGEKDSFVPQSITMTVDNDGDIRKYDLQATGFIPYWPLNLRGWPTK